MTRYSSLPAKQLYIAMSSSNRESRVVCGMINDSGAAFFMASGVKVECPLSVFHTSGDGVKPDFNDFKITDYGLTLSFGEYEASSDILRVR